MASTGDELSDNNDPLQHKILTLSFNQDSTALAMGTVKTYFLYNMNVETEVDSIRDREIKIYSTTKYFSCEEVHIVERLFSSSLIALVSSQAPRKLTVCDFKRGSEILSYPYPDTILAVKLNRSRLVVCLEESIWIHKMENVKVLHVIPEVSANNVGLCALSSNKDNPYLAYPGSSITGDIHIFDTNNLKPVISINAHDGPLAAMSFDLSGTRIATASNKGTVIRIHSPTNGSCLFEFRRGVRRTATIYSLAFSPDSMFLAASSNTETIHIFRLMKQTEKPTEATNTWMGSFNRLLGDVAYYLPKQPSEMLTQDRSFATVHLPAAGVRTTIAMNNSNKTLQLLVADYSGTVSVYEVNTAEGGECRQISQYLLFNLSRNPKNIPSSTSGAARRSSDPSARSYPLNITRKESTDSSYSSMLTNDRRYSSNSFSTAIDEHAHPQLSSTPESNFE